VSESNNAIGFNINDAVTYMH